MNSDQTNPFVLYGVILIGLFFLGIYLIRAVFNIPTLVRNSKAQVKLLEQIAKAQGVDAGKVTSIMSEIVAWEESN